MLRASFYLKILLPITARIRLHVHNTHPCMATYSLPLTDSSSLHVLIFAPIYTWMFMPPCLLRYWNNMHLLTLIMHLVIVVIFFFAADLCPCLPLPEAFKSALGSMLDISLLSNPVFLLIGVSNVFGMLGLYVPFVYLVDYAKQSVKCNSLYFVMYRKCHKWPQFFLYSIQLSNGVENGHQGNIHRYHWQIF